MSYDKNNIFAKILRGEIPCKKIYLNENYLYNLKQFYNFQGDLDL